MRVTFILAIASTIAFATAVSAESRQAVSTIRPITNPMRGVGTAALPDAPHGVSTDQGFRALPGRPGSPTFDPLGSRQLLATADEFGHHSIGTAPLIAFWWLQQEEVVEARFLGNDHDIADIPPRPGGGVLNRPHTTPT